MWRTPTSARGGAVLVCALLAASPAAGTSVHAPLTVTDAIGSNGTVTVQTPLWRLDFDELYNGGIHQWFDLAADPGMTDSLAGALAAGGTFPYSQGALFGYQAYLHGAPSMEFMTTMGVNADPGTLDLSVLEDSPARVRIRQRGMPRLNNGQGPLADVFPEIGFITATTTWTIYPTGGVFIDFTTEVDEAGVTIASGPGGGGHGVDAPGCCGNENRLFATGGADFREAGVLPGHTVESVSGAWGPIRIYDRPSPTELVLESPVPAGTGLDYLVRAREIVGETISIHGDGDVNSMCTIRPWQAGSNDKPLWEDSPVPQFVPNLSDQYVLAQWAMEGRSAGSLLSFFELPWPDANLAAFDSCVYEDISYTQVGRFGPPAVPTERHLHLLAQMGSVATACGLPAIRDVAAAIPIALDHRTPDAAALVGTLDAGPGIVGGFDPATGAYGVTAAAVAPAVCGAGAPPCYEVVVRFDAQGGARGGTAYHTPAIMLNGFPVADEHVSIEISTDGGGTFAPLPWRRFNLSAESDAAVFGSGRRLFQYLADVPASASGAAAVAFRFVGPTAAVIASPPMGVASCPAAPVANCRAAGRSTLSIRNPGGGPKKLAWKWLRGTTPVAAFAAPPACGASYAVCVYDAIASVPTRALAIEVPAGALCDGRPCWKTLGGTVATGYRYTDGTLAREGLKTVIAKGGQPGAGKVVVNGRGALLPLPAPASPTTFFHHQGDVVVQLVTDDGECWESLFAPGDARQNRPDNFRATSGG